MADNIEKKIQLSVNIIENFAAAKKNLDAAKKSLDNIAKSAQALTAELRELSAAEGDNSKAIAELADKLEELNAKLEEQTQHANSAADSMGNLSGQIQDATSIAANAIDTFTSVGKAINDLSTGENQLATATQAATDETLELTQAQIEALAAAQGMQEISGILDGMSNAAAITRSAFEEWRDISDQLGIANELAVVGLEKLNEVQQVVNKLSAVSKVLKAGEAAIQAIVNMQTLAGVAATKLQTAAESKNIVVRYAAAAAQAILNAIMAANPVMLLVTGIAALVGWLSIFSSKNKDAAATQEAMNKKLAETTAANDKAIERMKAHGNTQEEVMMKTTEMRQNEMRQAEEAFEHAKKYYDEDDDEYQEALKNKQAANERFQASVNDQLNLLESLAGKAEEINARMGKSDTEYTREVIQKRQAQTKAMIESLKMMGMMSEETAKKMLADLDTVTNHELGKLDKKEQGQKNQEAEKQRKKKLQEGLKELDSKEQLALKDLELNKNFDEKDLAAKQTHEATVFKTQQDWAKKKLQLQLASDKEFKAEYDRQMAQLEADEKLFNKNQQDERKKNADTQQQQLETAQKELMQMLGQETQLRIKEAQDAAKKTVDVFKNANAELEKSGKVKVDKTTGAASGNAEDVERYKQNAANIADIETQLQQNITQIEKDGVQAQVQARKEEIEKAVSEEFATRIAAAQGNAIEELKIEKEKLEKIKQQKLDDAKAKGETADTNEEDKALADTGFQLAEADAARQLALGTKTAAEKYRIERELLEKKLALYNKDSLEYAQTQEQIAALDASYQQGKIEKLSQYADAVKEAFSGISDIMKSMDEARLADAEATNASEHESLQAQLDANLISKDEYDAKIKESDGKLAKEKAAIARKQAIMDKASAVFDIGIKTAIGIMGAVAEFPLTAGMPWAAIIAAMGAIQLAGVIAKPIPKAARGSLIGGLSHAAGGTLIEAERGEAIINRRSVGLFPELLSLINEVGGGIPFTTANGDGGFSAREYRRQSGGNAPTAADIGTAVKAAVQDVKIYTAIEDINEGSKRYTEVKGERY